jgi:asparagine synthase (glutamine-hydrolysing)
VCGIAGVLSDQPCDVRPELLTRMGNSLSHRGPDDEGVWIAGTSTPAVGFVHRRLSIIDVSPAGHQPMPNEDESIWLTFNGEIYNHLELRRELERAGHRYRGHSDSETILHAYEEWGDACVPRLRGMFAFALWDSHRRRLLLVRDRLGIKPLYYARPHANRLIFGSEIKALFASTLLEPEVAPTAIPEYLLFGYLSGEDTMFRNVWSIPAGHLAVWDDAGLQVRSYWDAPFIADRLASKQDLQHTFDQLFESAVESHLMSDVPLGVLLSGGLDSSAIAAVMTRHAAGRLKTFSIGFPRGHYSELPHACTVAKHLGTEHHEVVLTPDEFLCSLPRMIWFEDEPIWTIASVAMYHVARLAAEHVKVVLSGEGSDELFAGYDRYWCAVINDRARPMYGRVPTGVRAAVRGALSQEAIPERLRRMLSHTFLCRELGVEDLVIDNWFGVFSPSLQREIGSDELRRNLAAADPYAAHLRQYQSSGSDQIVDQMLYADIRTNLVELLRKQDRMTMANSLEGRVPFLDHPLVEFAARSSHAALGHFSGKKMLKRCVQTLLPPAIVSRRKQGFPVPFETWLRTSFFTPVRNLLLSERALSRQWFAPEKVKSLLSAHEAGRHNYSRQLWALLTLELWQRIFFDRDDVWVDAPEEAWAPLRDDARRPRPLKRGVAVV